MDNFLDHVLACPACNERPPLEPVEGGYRCPECGRIYLARDGFPNLIIEEAKLDSFGERD